MDPIVEAMLTALVKTAPVVITTIADALKGGDTPEQAIAKARRLTPPRLDTSYEDETRRTRIRGAGRPEEP